MHPKQVAGRPMTPQQYQYGTVYGYYPTQNGTDWSSMFNMMMPMIMMIMMLAIMMPMIKSFSKAT